MLNLVPIEIARRILTILREQSQKDKNADKNLVLTSKLIRVLHRRSQPIQLLTEERARDFFWSAEQFHNTFTADYLR